MERNLCTELVVCILVFIILLLISIVILLVRSKKIKIAEIKAQAEAERERILAEENEKCIVAKNNFFATISHDMRTPLNAITGFIRMARKEDNTTKQRNEYLDKAEQSSILLLDLIDDTLAMSKTSSGKLELRLTPIRGKVIFESVIIPIRETASKKNITFTVDDSKELDRVILADELNMQKILLNLLSNAVKYTPAGGHINLKIYNEQKNNDKPDSIIMVSDDGIGISEEFLPYIFEPFTQERRHGCESIGTGLGLSVVKQLVNLMGGTIDVKSTKDKGTTFTVRLHFEPVTDVVLPKTEYASSVTVNLSGKKMLLCEDNVLNREIAVALLKDAKVDVVTAEDGKRGLQEFAKSTEGEFDAILMDVRMPAMDGYEATREIRSLNRIDAKSIPIVAMTADAFSADIDKCIASGMNGHIAKPIDPEKLYRTLEGVLK